MTDRQAEIRIAQLVERLFKLTVQGEVTWEKSDKVLMRTEYKDVRIFVSDPAYRVHESNLLFSEEALRQENIFWVPYDIAIETINSSVRETYSDIYGSDRLFEAASGRAAFAAQREQLHQKIDSIISD